MSTFVVIRLSTIIIIIELFVHGSTKGDARETD